MWLLLYKKLYVITVEQYSQARQFLYTASYLGFEKIDQH